MATLFTRTVILHTLRNTKPVQLSAAIHILPKSHGRQDLACNSFFTNKFISPAPFSSQNVRYFPADKNAPIIEEKAEDIKPDDNKPKVNINEAVPEKLSLFQRFKQMYRDYWYVLVPVHLVTSAGWFGGFYYMAKSGIDVVALMESMKISAKIISPLKDSSLGYFAISYAMYKIATPVRYTVTLGGTTVAINYLTKFGYIKPVPSREQLKEMYMEKKENIMDTMKDKREELRIKREALKDKTDNLIDNMERKIVTKINDTKKKTTSPIEKP